MRTARDVVTILLAAAVILLGLEARAMDRKLDRVCGTSAATEYAVINGGLASFPTEYVEEACD